MARFHHFISLACLIAATAGCSRSDLPSAVPLEGYVTYRQEPVDEASVVLVPTDPKGRSATGITDSNGHFSMKTYYDPKHTLPGAVHGDYIITITKREPQVFPPGLSSEETMEYQKTMKPPKSLIPEIYGVPAKSGFKVTVDGTKLEPLQLELKD